MGHLGVDLRCAVRGLSKRPGIALAAMLCLALGVGTTTSIFALTDRLLFRSLPEIRKPEEIVGLYRGRIDDPEALGAFSWPDYLAHAEAAETWQGLAAFASFDFAVGTGGPNRLVPGTVVSSNYFDVLGVEPLRGRFFSTTDSEAAPVVVLGAPLWEALRGDDPHATESTVRINGQTVTVIGIAPRAFQGTDRTSTARLWVPLSTFDRIATGPFAQLEGRFDRRQEWLSLVGRLASGQTLAGARAAVRTRAEQLAETFPETNRGETAVLLPLGDIAFGVGKRQKVVRYCGLLTGVGVVTLLLACLNLGSLLLARALARRQEIALRLALGARRGRLVELLWLEALLLVLLGGTVGLGAAALALPLIETLRLPVEVSYQLHFDGRVVASALALAGVVGLLVGAVPLLASRRWDLTALLRDESAGTTRARDRGQEILLTFQVALTVAVLITAALAGESLAGLRRLYPAAASTPVLLASLDLSAGALQGHELDLFHRELVRRIAELPAVEEVGTVSALPWLGQQLVVELTVGVEGAPPESEGRGVKHILADEGFFAALGLGAVRGRLFAEEDGPDSPGVVVINETMAREFWPGRDPVGARIALAPDESSFRVIAVVADSLFANLGEPRSPVLYLDRRQHRQSFLGTLLAPSMTLVVRTAVDPRVVATEARSIVHDLEPRFPLFGITTLADRLADATRLERQATWMLSSFGALALTLTLVGFYGLVVSSVLRRAREIGIRRALGARRRDAVLLILRGALLPLVAGVSAGLALGALASQLVENQLYGVRPVDALVYGGTGLLVLLGGLAIIVLAASRAARVAPTVALRES